MTIADDVRLVVPGREYLAAYVAALRRGWSPDNIRGQAAAEKQLEWIEKDADGFLASLDDPEARGPPVEQRDGSYMRRLPGIVRWILTDDFCGSIGFRWEHGTAELPPHVLGHIGYAIVPWKRGQGVPKQALALMLDEPRRLGLPYVEITTTADNLASRRVVEANGGELVEGFVKAPAQGEGEALRFRIPLG